LNKKFIAPFEKGKMPLFDPEKATLDPPKSHLLKLDFLPFLRADGFH
jgi:hypothetical protein